MRGEHLAGSITFEAKERIRAINALAKAKELEQEFEQKAKDGLVIKTVTVEERGFMKTIHTKYQSIKTIKLCTTK